MNGFYAINIVTGLTVQRNCQTIFRNCNDFAFVSLRRTCMRFVSPPTLPSEQSAVTTRPVYGAPVPLFVSEASSKIDLKIFE
jgi:hypothetical protein